VMTGTTISFDHQRCNVNDASHVRRCWCSSDAEHTRGYGGLARCDKRGPRGELGLEVRGGVAHSRTDARDVCEVGRLHGGVRSSSRVGGKKTVQIANRAERVRQLGEWRGGVISTRVGIHSWRPPSLQLLHGPRMDS
jgi:hypothetical protein